MASVKEIETQFNSVAHEYDAGRRKFIPCFNDYYEKTTDFIANSITPPKRILDLGAGTGLLTMYYYRHFPDAQYVLTDVAESMLSVAKERFRGIKNIEYSCADYMETMPEGKFSLIVSALSIHHLEDGRKQELFHAIEEKLSHGGMFINYDQFCADTPEMSEKFDRYWVKHLQNSGLSSEDLAKWRERRKLDRECSVSSETIMLKNCGFSNVQTVYSSLKFSVIVSCKK